MARSAPAAPVLPAAPTSGSRSGSRGGNGARRASSAGRRRGAAGAGAPAVPVSPRGAAHVVTRFGRAENQIAEAFGLGQAERNPLLPAIAERQVYEDASNVLGQMHPPGFQPLHGSSFWLRSRTPSASFAMSPSTRQ